MAAQGSQLPHIPFELRQIIWDFTLPPRRIFHVNSTPRVQTERLSHETQRLYNAWFGHNAEPQQTSVETSIGFSCFKFKKHHPPPVITRICRESRDRAIRAGYFVLPTLYSNDEDRISVAWFDGTSDLLYYPSKNAPTNLAHFTGLPYFLVANLARMSSVAVGWWYLLSPPLESWVPDRPAEILQDRLLAIYAHMPAIKTLYIVLPDFRDPEASRGAEEPLDDAGNVELVTVPDSTIVYYNNEFKPWGDVVRELYGLVDPEMVLRWHTIFEGLADFPPQIVGYWLPGAAVDGVLLETVTSD